MGINFRKLLSVLPGAGVNVGSRGVNSVTIGFPGLNINVNKDGRVRGTVGLPGTGLRYTKELYKK